MAADTVNVTKRQEQVLTVMFTKPDKLWISDEICNHPFGDQGLWKRLNELEKKGFISVHWLARKGSAGKDQQQYYLTAKAKRLRNENTMV
jgi:hypothetical protein